MIRIISGAACLVVFSSPAIAVALDICYNKNESCSGCGSGSATVCDEEPTSADSGFRSGYERVPRKCRGYGDFETSEQDCSETDPSLTKTSCPPSLGGVCCYVSITVEPDETTPDPDDKILKLDEACGRELVPGGPGGTVGGG